MSVLARSAEVEMVPLVRPRPPLYYRVYKILETRIRNRQYRVGERLPSEDALCRDFGVSRMTIRQALGGLVETGLLTRRRGSGSWVSATGEPRASAQMNLTGALEDLFAEATTATVDTAHIEESLPPPEVQSAMGLAEGELVTVIRRVRRIEHQPFALTIDYLPRRLGRRLAERELYRFPLLQLLEGKLAVRFRHADQIVEARLADEDVAAALGIEFGDPVLFVERLMFAAGEWPIEVVRSHYRADIYRYRVRLVRGARGERPGQPAPSPARRPKQTRGQPGRHPWR